MSTGLVHLGDVEPHLGDGEQAALKDPMNSVTRLPVPKRAFSWRGDLWVTVRASAQPDDSLLDSRKTPTLVTARMKTWRFPTAFFSCNGQRGDGHAHADQQTRLPAVCFPPWPNAKARVSERVGPWRRRSEWRVGWEPGLLRERRSSARGSDRIWPLYHSQTGCFVKQWGSRPEIRCKWPVDRQCLGEVIPLLSSNDVWLCLPKLLVQAVTSSKPSV